MPKLRPSRRPGPQLGPAAGHQELLEGTPLGGAGASLQQGGAAGPISAPNGSSRGALSRGHSPCPEPGPHGVRLKLRCRRCQRFSWPRRPVVVAASVPRCTATAARHHRVAATAARPWLPSTARRGCSLVRWARLPPSLAPLAPALWAAAKMAMTAAGLPRPWGRGEKGGQARPVSSDASARQWGDRPTERRSPRGVGIRGRAPPAVDLHVSHAALETETGISKVFRLRLVFLPGRRVLVLPEVVLGPREPRRLLLLVVRPQLTAGSEEGVGGACAPS